MMNNYLVFRLAGRLFGVKLVGAIEILPWRRSRPVPLSYSHVEGLLDHRGTIFPVLNISHLLGISKPGPIGFTPEEKKQIGAEGQSIILLEENKNPFGILVDGVAQMTSLEEGAATPEKIQGVDPAYVKGIAEEANQEIVILDFERLFNAG